MASSTTEMANMALAHLAVDKEIADLDTESGAEARACRRFFAEALKCTFRDFDHPFSRKIAELSLITDAEDDDHPTDEWDYQYGLPADCLKFRKIQSGFRVDARNTRVSYQEAHGEDGTVIYTDQEDAIGEYTYYVTDILRYPPDFVLAFSFRLAAYICPVVCGPDFIKLGDRAMKHYLHEISIAKATAVNEEQPDEDMDSEFIRERG